MATGNFERATYYTVRDGKVVREFKAPTGKSIPRINKNAREVHEEFYDYIEGFITDLKVVEKKEQNIISWHLHLTDYNGEKSIVQFPYDGGLASSFLKILPNVDPVKEIRLCPTVEVDGDKKRSKFFIQQGGKYLKQFWNQKNPGDLPPLEKRIQGRKEVWDGSEQLAWLEKWVNTEFLPTIKREPVQASSSVTKSDTPVQDAGMEDAPF